MPRTTKVADFANILDQLDLRVLAAASTDNNFNDQPANTLPSFVAAFRKVGIWVFNRNF